MEKKEIDFYKNHPIFKELNLTDIEVITHFCELDKALEDYNNCQKSEELCNSSYHFKLIRNKFNQLELISYECEKYLNNLEYLRKKYLWFSNVEINNDLEFKKENVSQYLDQNFKLIKYINDIKKDYINSNNLYLITKKIDDTNYLFKLLLNSLIIKKISCCYLNTKFLAKEFELNQIDTINKLDFIKNVDILFIEDLGSEKCSNFLYYLNQLNLLLKWRFNHQKKVLISSKFNLIDLKKNYLMVNSSFKNDSLKYELDDFISLLKDNISLDSTFNLKINNK